MMAATLVGFTGYALPAETPDPLSLVPQWDMSFALRGGAGYKDNVFLSHFEPQGSAFLEAGGDVLVARVAVTGPELEFFTTGDVQQFLAGDAAHTEYSALAGGKVAHDLGTWGNGSLVLHYFAQDQILDVSETETNREALEVIGHALTGRPRLRVPLSSNYWAACEAYAIRQFLAAPLDDYWQGGAVISCGRFYSRKSEVSLSYEPAWRFYDHDPALTASGAVIPGSHRERFQHEARLRWRHDWDAADHWRTTVTLGGRLNQENGGGFSDYVRWLAAVRVEYRVKRWRASAEARATQYLYQNQTTATAGSTTLLRRTDVILNARVERELFKKLSVVAAYEYEHALSKEPLETYAVNMVTGSLLWEF